MVCIPGTGTCVALATIGGVALTVGGIAATGYEATAEYQKYKKGESVFNTDEEREAYIKKQFLESCEKNPDFSADCPSAKNENDDVPAAPPSKKVDFKKKAHASNSWCFSNYVDYVDLTKFYVFFSIFVIA